MPKPSLEATLYRALLRLARDHDRTPAAKAFFVGRRSRQYDFERSAWQPAEPSEPGRRLFDAATRELFQGGDFYTPEVSAAALCRSWFRRPLAELPAGASAGQRLDFALQATRALTDNLADLEAVERAARAEAPFASGEVAAAMGVDGGAVAGLRAVPAAAPAAVGELLVAHPLQLDGMFARSVVLLCEHGPDYSEGAILNLRVPHVLGRLSSHEALSEFQSAPVFCGGPSGDAQAPEPVLRLLHTHGALEGAAPVADTGLFWGGEVEAANQAVLDGAASAEDFRFVLGVSNWGRDQLQGELELGVWVRAASSSSTSSSSSVVRELALDNDRGMWGAVLRGMGGEYAELARLGGALLGQASSSRRG